jgi:hypothetical protein
MVRDQLCFTDVAASVARFVLINLAAALIIRHKLLRRSNLVYFDTGSLRSGFHHAIASAQAICAS